jgi:YVTN family beta-propeller protein
VANTNSKDVWLIETNQYKVLKKIQIDGFPCQVLFSQDAKSLYVGCCFGDQQQGKIITIDLSDFKVVSEIVAACVPYRMVQISGGSFLLMTSAGTGRLDVVDLRSMSIRASIKTGSMANDVAFDITEQFAYVTNTLEGTVSVVDWFASKKICDIKVGNEPNGVIRI